MVATASPDTDEAHADSLRTHSVGGRPLKSSGIDTTSTIKPDEGISVQPSDIIESTGADSPGAGGDDGLTSLNGELTIHDCSLVERQQLKGLFKPGRDTGETRFQHTQGNQNLSPGGHFSSPDHVIILPGERSDRGVPNERSETTDACCVGTASILSGCDRVTSNSPDHHDRLPRHKCWNKQQVTRAFDHQDGKTTILKAGELSSSGSREKAKVRMEVTDQALVSSSLVDIFEQASVGNVDTTNDDDGSMRTELGSLTIRLCNLPSFAPVTSLAHNLRLMRDLVLDDCTISSLMGLERVLADSPCLQTLTLRCCRLYQLPQLESSSIRVLDLSYNSLKEVKGTETLCRLEKLNLSGNSIESLDGLRPLVPLGSGVLRQLDVSGNPVQSLPRYRASVVEMIPSIRLLDGTPIAALNWCTRLATSKFKSSSSSSSNRDDLSGQSPGFDNTKEAGTDHSARIPPRSPSEDNLIPNLVANDSSIQDHGTLHGTLMEMESVYHGSYAQPSYKNVASPTTRPRRDRFVDGYCSARSAWESVAEAAAVSMRAKASERNGLDSKKRQGYVRGLAGLGLIWGGGGRPGSCPGREMSPPMNKSSSSATARARGSRMEFGCWNTNSPGVILGVGKKALGSPVDRQPVIGVTYSLPSSSCPPSPERRRQIEADKKRSQPTRRHERNFELQGTEKEVYLRERGKGCGRTTSRRKQDVIMARLARPVRASRQHIRRGNLQEEIDSRASDTSFAEAMFCLHPELLMDRPTAFKGIDGKWEAVLFPGKTRRNDSTLNGRAGGARRQKGVVRNDMGATAQGDPSAPEMMSVKRAGRQRTSVGGRVLRTSWALASALGRIFEVNLSQDEAKFLYESLDADRDGTLGAEDLLRGVPTLASFLEHEQRCTTSRTTRARRREKSERGRRSLPSEHGSHRWDEYIDRRWQGGRCCEYFDKRDLLCGPRATSTPPERQDGLDIPAWGNDFCCQGQRGFQGQRNDGWSFEVNNEGARIADVDVREGDLVNDNRQSEKINSEVTRESLCPGEDGNTGEAENGHVVRRYAHISSEDGHVREDEDTKEEDEHMKKEDGHIKKEDGHTKKEDEHMKKEDGHIKKEDGHTKKEDEHTKKEDEHTKEDGHTKKEDRQTKKEGEHTTKEDEHTKKEDEHTKKEDEHTKKEDEHMKKEDEHLKKEDGQTKKENGHTKKDDGHTKKEDGHTKKEDEYTKKEDERERQMGRGGYRMTDNLYIILEDGCITKDGQKSGDEEKTAEHTHTREGGSVVLDGREAEAAEETGNDAQTTEAEEATEDIHAGGEGDIVPREGSSSDHVSDGDVHEVDDRYEGEAENSAGIAAGQDPRTADMAAQLCLGEDWRLVSRNEFHAPALWSRGRRGWTQGWSGGERMTKVDEGSASHRHQLCSMPSRPSTGSSSG